MDKPVADVQLSDTASVVVSINDQGAESWVNLRVWLSYSNSNGKRVPTSKWVGIPYSHLGAVIDALGIALSSIKTKERSGG